MKLLVVEDDPLETQAIVDEITDAFPTSQVMTISSERMFLRSAPDLEMHPPDVALVHVLLPWSHPEDFDWSAADGTPDAHPRP